MARMSSERRARVLAAMREEKRQWLEHLKRRATKEPNFNRLCAMLESFTGFRWEELTDKEYTVLAAEYWKMKKSKRIPPPAGPVQRPAWLTQTKIDRLITYYTDNGKPITEDEAIIAWTQFMDWTRELANLDKGERDEENRVGQE